MEEYISREAALNAINVEVQRQMSALGPHAIHVVDMPLVLNAIQKLPAADVRPVVWIPFETRPMDEEERAYYSEQYGFALADEEAVIYCCQMPDHGQEVLVCNQYGNVWIDIFDDDPDYGIGFETNGDMDGLVAWMPLPKPYAPPNCGADMREEQT